MGLRRYFMRMKKRLISMLMALLMMVTMIVPSINAKAYSDGLISDPSTNLLTAYNYTTLNVSMTDPAGKTYTSLSSKISVKANINDAYDEFANNFGCPSDSVLTSLPHILVVDSAGKEVPNSRKVLDPVDPGLYSGFTLPISGILEPTIGELGITQSGTYYFVIIAYPVYVNVFTGVITQVPTKYIPISWYAAAKAKFTVTLPSTTKKDPKLAFKYTGDISRTYSPTGTLTTRPASSTASPASTGAITYTSSNTKVATVNKTTGVVTYKGVGQTTIKASIAETSKYKSAVTSYKLTITQATPTAKFAATSVTKNLSDGTYTNTFTKTGDGAVSYKTSDKTIATVSSAGKVTFKKAGTVTVTASLAATTNYKAKSVSYTLTIKDGSSSGGSTPTPTPTPTPDDIDVDADIIYQTHVQNIGWQNWVSNGTMAGTSGQSLRLEGINIKLDGNTVPGGVEYRTHIQNIGWQDFKANGAMSGTSGRSLRLEAIEIRLTGEISNYYDVYYRVHAQNFGWLGWAKNGEPAGSAGYSYRLEGINIMLVKKGDAAPGSRLNAFRQAGKSTGVNYRTHVQNVGWQGYKANGEMSGTSGRSLRLEGININLANMECSGGIEYRTHIQNIGWESQWKSNGAMSGTSGRSLRLEAIQIRLTGEVANRYDVYYRVHAQNYGWLGWAKNGESAGTSGQSLRLEGIQIVLVPKGQGNPGNVSGIVSKYSNAHYGK